MAKSKNQKLVEKMEFVVPGEENKNKSAEKAVRTSHTQFLFDIRAAIDEKCKNKDCSCCRILDLIDEILRDNGL